MPKQQIKHYFLKKYIFIIAIVLIIVFINISSSYLAYACTIWAVSGSRVEGGGLLIAKNRDWVPNNHTSIRFVKQINRYSYIGLFSKGGKVPGLKAGVNEKGLVVIGATASCILNRSRYKYKKNLYSSLLKTTATVDEALRKKSWFYGPRFLIIADKQKIALIEIGTNRISNARVYHNSYAFHTNHYLESHLQKFNFHVSPSSRVRLDRIEKLLKTQSTIFTTQDFIRISEDRNAGADNSIWREGSNPRKTRTLAAFIVSITPDGKINIYIKTANPGEQPKVHNINANDVFSGRVRV